MEEKKQTFMIQDETGVTRKAEVITMINIEDREYLIYSLDEGNDMVTICASKVVKDEEGNDKIVDIDNDADKAKITEFINELSK